MLKLYYQQFFVVYTYVIYRLTYIMVHLNCFELAFIQEKYAPSFTEFLKWATSIKQSLLLQTYLHLEYDCPIHLFSCVWKKSIIENHS